MDIADTKAYDQLLEQTPRLGGMGVFQCCLLLLVGVACSCQALHMLSSIFIMVEQESRCAIPGLANDTYHIQSESHWRMLNSSVPSDSSNHGGYSQCFRFKDSLNETAREFLLDRNISSALPLEKCSQWVYNTDMFATSVISEFSLVCERHMYSKHANMLTLAGLMAGSLVSGPLSDRFGRKTTFLLFSWLEFVAATSLVFVPSVSFFLLVRFLITTAGFSAFMTACILCMEVMSPRHRTIAGIITNFGWSCGMLVLLLAAYLLRDWRHIQLALSSPLLVIAIAYIWLLPESPRWLLNKGRYSEAQTIICKMARANKCDLPEKSLLADVKRGTSPCPRDQKAKGSQQSILALLRSPVLLFRLIVMAIGWLVNSMVYYGLTLNVGSIIEGNIFLNFLIMALLELVSYFILVKLAKRGGRKVIFCSCMFLGGVSCLATILPMVLSGGNSPLMIALSNLGKFFITCSFTLLWVYATELWPTHLRQSSVGICSFVGRAGAIISPYIGRMHEIISGPLGKVLPLVVFGSAALVSGVLALFLPETLNQKLPETIEEAEQLGRRTKQRETSMGTDQCSSC